jgi:HEPN domain-containing protein
LSAFPWLGQRPARSVGIRAGRDANATPYGLVPTSSTQARFRPLGHPGGFYEDACFSAQQSSELAAKALLESQGHIEFGHSVFQLLQTAGGVPANVLDAARVLDRYYIPTRYPNGFPAGAPMDFYDQPTAEEAVSLAERILEFVGTQL